MSGKAISHYWTAISAVSAAVAAAFAAFALCQNAKINQLQVDAAAPFLQAKSITIERADSTRFLDRNITENPYLVKLKLENAGGRPAQGLTTILIRTKNPADRESTEIHTNEHASTIGPGGSAIIQIPLLGKMNKDEPRQFFVVELRYKDLLVEKDKNQTLYMRWNGLRDGKGKRQLSLMTKDEKSKFDSLLGYLLQLETDDLKQLIRRR